MTSRNWCFTLNNYTEDDICDIQAWDVDYMVYGHEVGESGTPHLQGYAEFKVTKRLETLKKLNTRIHWGYRLADRESCILYCKKGNQSKKEWDELKELGPNYGRAATIFEKGKRKKSQGKRNDLSEIKAMVKNGENMREIFDEANSFQALKMAEAGMKLFEPKRDFKPQVTWLWGPTGVGKSYRAFKEAVNPWVSGVNLKWFDGYDQHEDVIFDDFRADFCTFHVLLRLLDRYPMIVETKGGSRQFLAKRIWITSCHHPGKIYNKSDEDQRQLLRRIDYIVHVSEEDGKRLQEDLNDEKVRNFIKEQIEILEQKSDLQIPPVENAITLKPRLGAEVCDRAEVGGNTITPTKKLNNYNNRTPWCDTVLCDNTCACNFMGDEDDPAWDNVAVADV